MLTRRDGLKLTLSLAAWAGAATRLAPVSPARAAVPVFKVPPLGYGYDAFEPYIDTLTMTIHHDKHHGAYVAALNGLIEKYPGLATTSPVVLLSDLTVVPDAVRAPVRNNLGGHWNHSVLLGADDSGRRERAERRSESRDRLLRLARNPSSLRKSTRPVSAASALAGRG